MVFVVDEAAVVQILPPGTSDFLPSIISQCADHVTPLYPQKLALSSPTGGGRSVGIVRSRTKATEFSLVFSFIISQWLRTHTIDMFAMSVPTNSNSFP